MIERWRRYNEEPKGPYNSSWFCMEVVIRTSSPSSCSQTHILKEFFPSTPILICPKGKHDPSPGRTVCLPVTWTRVTFRLSSTTVVCPGVPVPLSPYLTGHTRRSHTLVHVVPTGMTGSSIQHPLTSLPYYLYSDLSTVPGPVSRLIKWVV